jgi:hypothetical protein
LEINIAKNSSKLKRCIICKPLAQYNFLSPLVLKIQEYDPKIYNCVDTKITKDASKENYLCKNM